MILLTVVACDRPKPAPDPTSDPAIDVEKLLDEAGAKIRAMDVMSARDDLARLGDELDARKTAPELRARLCATRCEIEFMTGFLDPQGALPWLDRCEAVAVEGFYPVPRLEVLATRANVRLRAGMASWSEDKNLALILAKKLGLKPGDESLQVLRDAAGYLSHHPDLGSHADLQVEISTLTPR